MKSILSFWVCFVLWVASRPAGAATYAVSLQFDGLAEAVEIPHDAALNSLPITITAWFKTTQLTEAMRYPGIVTKYDGQTRHRQ